MFVEPVQDLIGALIRRKYGIEKLVQETWFSLFSWLVLSRYFLALKKICAPRGAIFKGYGSDSFVGRSLPPPCLFHDQFGAGDAAISTSCMNHIEQVS